MLPGREPEALVTTGPFRLSRNPLYVALTLLYAGFAIVLNVLWSLFLLPAAVVLMTYLVVKPEERTLGRIFGEEYARYRERVRRWI